MAASSSLQLRAISNFGTWSATATTSCELKTIIETETGIVGLLLLRLGRIAKNASRTSQFLEVLRLSSMQKRTIEHRRHLTRTWEQPGLRVCFSTCVCNQSANRTRDGGVEREGHVGFRIVR